MNDLERLHERIAVLEAKMARLEAGKRDKMSPQAMVAVLLAAAILFIGTVLVGGVGGH